MVLSDRDIRALMRNGSLVISPDPVDGAIQPASVDLTLSNEFSRYSLLEPIDPIDPPKMEGFIAPSNGFELMPGECVLGSTVEYVSIPSNIAARVEGKSSRGRIFLLVHCTAGFIDPGFAGNITLEIKNLNAVPILIRPNMSISQICFIRMPGSSDRPYGHDALQSRYQGSIGTVGPRRGR